MFSSHSATDTNTPHTGFTSNPPVTLRFTSTLSQTPLMLFCVEALGRLSQILEDHQEWHDPLSQKMRIWTVRVIVEDSQIEFESDDALRHFGELRLNELVNQVVIDKILKTPLQDPVLLDNGWTCERSYAEIGLPNLTAITHEFAKAILAWTNPLIINQEPANALIDARHYPNSQLGQALSLTLRVASRNLLTAERLEKACIRSETSIQLAARAAEIAQQEAKECLEETKKIAIETRQEILSGLDAAEKSIAEELKAANWKADALETVLLSTKKELGDTKGELNSTRCEVQAQRAEIKDVKAENLSLKSKLGAKRSCIIS